MSRAYKDFTEKDLKKIIRLFEKGTSKSQICRIMDCWPDTVSRVLNFHYYIPSSSLSDKQRWKIYNDSKELNKEDFSNKYRKLTYATRREVIGWASVRDVTPPKKITIIRKPQKFNENLDYTMVKKFGSRELVKLNRNLIRSAKLVDNHVDITLVNNKKMQIDRQDYINFKEYTK